MHLSRKRVATMRQARGHAVTLTRDERSDGAVHEMFRWLTHQVTGGSV
jgi:hypothetical protein